MGKGNTVIHNWSERKKTYPKEKTASVPGRRGGGQRPVNRRLKLKMNHQKLLMVQEASNVTAPSAN